MGNYSLNDFCDEVRSTLSARDDHDSRDVVRQKLEKLLGDQDFLDEYVGEGREQGVTQIYEDPELKFCILAYNMSAPRKSPPHDHGDSWAVYGQAAGYTDMTIWSAEGKGESGVEPIRSFRLDAGQAGLFDVHEIHSIEYAEGSKFVRVTGVDLGTETRRVFDPETGEVKEIEAVGTGSSR